MAASVGGSPAEAGVGCGSLCGQGHWQQKFWEVLLGVSPPRVPGRFLKDLFNAAFQVNHMESKVLFQPILFLSKRGGKVPATADGNFTRKIQLVMVKH